MSKKNVHCQVKTKWQVKTNQKACLKRKRTPVTKKKACRPKAGFCTMAFSEAGFSGPQVDFGGECMAHVGLLVKLPIKSKLL
jgi:hypothetical protein